MKKKDRFNQFDSDFKNLKIFVKRGKEVRNLSLIIDHLPQYLSSESVLPCLPNMLLGTERHSGSFFLSG